MLRNVVYTLCLGMALMTRMITSDHNGKCREKELQNVQNFENDDDEEKGLF